MKNRRIMIAVIMLIALLCYVCFTAFQNNDPTEKASNNTIAETSKPDEKKEGKPFSSDGHKEDTNSSEKPSDSEEGKSEATDTDNISTNSSNTKPSNSQSNQTDNHSNTGSGNFSSNSSNGHYETRYETIPAYDEEVLVKDGYYESVLVKEAWDEEDTYCYAFGQDQIEVAVCNTCGESFTDGSINSHLQETLHSGWHNEYVLTGDPYCKEYKTDYIHHDAVYDRVWHEPEYKTVHHPEEIRSYEVWVDN